MNDTRKLDPIPGTTIEAACAEATRVAAEGNCYRRRSMAKPKARTKQQVRDMFLDKLWVLIKYWEGVPKETTREKLEGLTHSILSTIDGCSMEFPAVDIVMRPHADDKAYHKSKGEDWFPPGLCINDDVHLHELLYQREP